MEEKNTSKKAYTFSDVLIVPKYSEVESRKNVDISSDFSKFSLGLPVVAANMKTICSSKMAIAMAENGGMGILHRFCGIDRAVEDFLEVKNHFENEPPSGVSYSAGDSKAYFQVENKITETSGGFSISSNAKPISRRDYAVGVSIGVQDPDDRLRFDRLYESGARIFAVDVANGYCELLRDIVGWILAKNLKDVYIIGGNIATGEAAYDLAEWGVNCVKVGVGPGSACLTRKNTGIGVPQLYALEEIAGEFSQQGVKNVKIICDGGMSSIGDLAKALKFADACMLGKMLAGTTETPGEVMVGEDGSFFKNYFGSASTQNKISTNNGANEYIEGVAKIVPFRGHVRHILKHIKDGLQSALSYTNSRNLQEFRQNCEFVEITSGGKSESKI